MDPGYLYIETSASHPGKVRLLATTGKAPSPVANESADPVIVHIARFNDVEAARLHAFSALRRYLLDVDGGLFRVEVTEAIAVVESIGLAHSRLFLDPSLGEAAREVIGARTLRRRRSRQLVDRAWQVVGWIAAGWLAILAISGM